MKAILFPGDGKVEVREIPDPHAGPGEVVVRMVRSGICGTDLHLLRQSERVRGAAASIVPGHETSGVISEVGDGVTRLTPGDRVIGYHHIGCGSCEYCRSGIPVYCRSKRVTGRTMDGSNAEYIVLPEHGVLPLPDRYSFSEGVLLACNVSTAYSAVRKSGACTGDAVAVFGQGVVGLAATMILCALGARVASIDPSSPRRSLALELGAELTVDPGVNLNEALDEFTAGNGLSAAIECSGAGSASEAGILALRPAGTLVQVGAGGTLSIPVANLLPNEVVVKGSSVYRPGEYEPMLRLIEGQRLPLARLISREFEVSEAEHAYAVAAGATEAKLLFAWSDVH